MRLAELSDRSGVSLATIKYYLRERLLPPGRRVSSTLAEYDESHLRRLRLVRALIQVGRVSVADARQVLAYVDDDSLGRTIRLGAALWSLPQNPEPGDAPGSAGTTDTGGAGSTGDPVTAAARQEVECLLEMLGWSSAREIGDLSPVYRSLVTAVAMLLKLGYQCDAEMLAPRARLMQQLAVQDFDTLDTLSSDAERAEFAVASAVLFEPVLTTLHRLAQEEESSRRYGIE